MRAAVLILACAAVATAQDSPAIDPHSAPRIEVSGAVPAAVVERVGVLAPAVTAEVARSIPGTPKRPFRVVLHASAAGLEPAQRESLHPETPGFALLGRDELHVILDELGNDGGNDLRTVLAHEIVHVLLDQFAGENAPHVPRWFHEGLAQVLSGDTYLGAREEDIVFAASTGGLPPFSQLRSGFPEDPLGRRTAYAMSYSFVGFLIREEGIDEVVAAAALSDPRHGYAFGFGRLHRESLAPLRDAWIRYLVHESGATARIHFNNCFSYLMIPAIVLLAFAVARRLDREARIRARLEADEPTDLPPEAPTPPGPPPP